MRKLKLEVQITIDGFIADPAGKTDWAVWNWAPVWNWDQALRQYHIELTTSSDCILLSRKFVEGDFLTHWQAMGQDPDDPQYPFAKAITTMQKVVVSRTLTESKWDTVAVVNGDLSQEVNRLKNQPGKDLIVYGGAQFVAALLKASLIDELHLFINPVAIGQGMPIFSYLEGYLPLRLEKSTAFECGVVVSKYVVN
ncbi:dihydrofolate reductase family protein [Larkinella ripae]